MYELFDVYILSILQFSCFWKIPRNAWRVIHSRHATHTNFSAFLGSCEQPPSGELYVARRCKLHNPVSGFSYERSSGDEHPLGDASQFSTNWCFCEFWANSGYRKYDDFRDIETLMVNNW